jgi:hypothetical protein
LFGLVQKLERFFSSAMCPPNVVAPRRSGAGVR